MSTLRGDGDYVIELNGHTALTRVFRDGVELKYVEFIKVEASRDGNKLTLRVWPSSVKITADRAELVYDMSLIEPKDDPA